VNVRLATDQVSAEIFCTAFNSTTSNEMHNLERVAFAGLDLPET
jgi:hypothetical protein